jgi:acyl carrier protein
MTKMQFYSELETMLEMDQGSIKGDESVLDLPGWDSLAVLTFISMADAKLNVTVSAASLMSCRTVDDLAALFPGKVS